MFTKHATFITLLLAALSFTACNQNAGQASENKGGLLKEDTTVVTNDIKSAESESAVTAPQFSPEGKDSILNQFSKGNIDSILAYCDLPFIMDVGQPATEREFSDKEKLRKALQQLLDQKFFESWLKAEAIYGEDQVQFTARSFNQEGELESESALLFTFRKDKNNQLKLFFIALAG